MPSFSIVAAKRWTHSSMDCCKRMLGSMPDMKSSTRSHSVDRTGRSAVLVSVDNFDFLLYHDGDKIPHVTNPQFASVSGEQLASSNLTAIPTIANRYVKVHAASPIAATEHLVIYNLLGVAIASRRIEVDAGDNTEYFETTGWASGTYTAELNADNQVSTTRFIVQH